MCASGLVDHLHGECRGMADGAVLIEGCTRKASPIATRN